MDRETKTSYEPDELSHPQSITDQIAEELSDRSHRLSIYALTISVVTALNLCTAAAIWIAPIVNRGRSLSTSAQLMLLGFDVSLALYGALALSVYERQKKRADGLYLELSDELQWHIRSGKDYTQKKTAAATSSPDIRMRIVLRTYLGAAELPFIPGRLGPAIYLCVNLACTAIAFVGAYVCFAHGG